MKQSALMIIVFTLMIGACSKSEKEAVTSAPPSPAPEGTPIVVPPPPSRPAAEDFAKSHPPAPAKPAPAGPGAVLVMGAGSMGGWLGGRLQAAGARVLSMQTASAMPRSPRPPPPG